MTDNELVAKAKEALEYSYSPYSHFAVGAALLSTDGQVFTGCNIENSSFGATNCAERTAIFKAVSEGVKDFKAIAIVCSGDQPAYPCGICRQVMSEFFNPDTRIIVEEGGGTLKTIPYQPNVFAFFYNKDLFEQAGITEEPKLY